MRTTTTTVPTGLQALGGFGFPVLASPDAQARAAAVAGRCRRALDWLADSLGERPAFTLVVAGRRDWPRVARVPLYGMPHAFPGLIVTGAEPSGFWRDYADTLLADLPPHGRERLTAVYGDPPAVGDRFADLIVVHELAHLFHDYDEQTGLTSFPRLWLAELFANVALHGYVVDQEPDRRPTLETICRLTWDAPAARWPVRDLDRMEAALAEGPLNYVWFQLRLLVVAQAIWRSAGAHAISAFRDSLTARDLSDSGVLDRITVLSPEAATALQHWPA